MCVAFCESSFARSHLWRNGNIQPPRREAQFASPLAPLFNRVLVRGAAKDERIAAVFSSCGGEMGSAQERSRRHGASAAGYASDERRPGMALPHRRPRGDARRLGRVPNVPRQVLQDLTEPIDILALNEGQPRPIGDPVLVEHRHLTPGDERVKIVGRGVHLELHSIPGP